MLYAQYHLRGWDTSDDEANRPTLYYIWQWFLELNETRESGLPFRLIRYSEMAAWSAIRQLTVRKFEWTAIMRIDRLYRSIVEKRNESDVNIPGGTNDGAIASFMKRATKIETDG